MCHTWKEILATLQSELYTDLNEARISLLLVITLRNPFVSSVCSTLRYQACFRTRVQFQLSTGMPSTLTYPVCITPFEYTHTVHTVHIRSQLNRILTYSVYSIWIIIFFLSLNLLYHLLCPNHRLSSCPFFSG